MEQVTIYSNCIKTVAHMPELHDALKPFAEGLQKAIKARIAPHSKTETFEESIMLVEGRVDWYITSIDPDAVSKDFGRLEPDGSHSQGVGAFKSVLGGKLR